MFIQDEEVEVEYACDLDGNHMASIAQCTASKKRKFGSLTEATPFIEQCSYVYNADELYENEPLEKIPTSLQGKVYCTLTCN